MANTAFTHDPTITVPSSTVNNRVVTWNGTTGKVFDNTALVTIAAGVVAGVTTLTASTSITTPSVLLSGSSNTLTLDVAAVTAAYTIIFPDAVPGAAGKVLQSSGSSPHSTLAWVTPSGGDLSFGGDAFGAAKVVGSTDAFAFAFATHGTTRMHIVGEDTSGNVEKGFIGIGTTSPTRPLHIAGNWGRAQLRLERTVQATGIAILGAGDGMFSVMDSGSTRLFNVTTSSGDVEVVSGNLYVGETANSFQTQGITINQGTSDNEILCFKSTTDVGHGMTNLVGNNTYGAFGKINPTTGGLMIRGFNDSGTRGLYLEGVAVGVNTAKTTGAEAAIQITPGMKDGTGQTYLSSNANLMMLANWITTRFIWDAEGSAHADVEWTEYDDENDIELMRGVHAELVPNYKERAGQDFMYNLKSYEDMKLIGKDSVHIEHRDDGRIQLRGMVNITGMMMLHHSTILQMHDNFKEIIQSQEQRISQLESQLTLSEGFHKE